MASYTTSNVYIHVIEDVINKVRNEFINDPGTGESVLTELQGLWELKMMQAGAILGLIDRSVKVTAAGLTPNPVHDLNVPYEGTEEFETPTADLLFPPTPLQTPMQTPLPGTGHTPLPGMGQTPLPGMSQTPLTGSDSGSLYNIGTGSTPITPSDYTSFNAIGGVPDGKTGLGRPSPYMQPPSPWINQRPPLDVNVAYVEGREEGERGAPNQPATQDFFMTSGKRKRDDIPPRYHPGGYIPQQDGAGDTLSDELKVQGAAQQKIVQGGTLSSQIPQLDGPIPDPYDDAFSTPNMYDYQGVVNEDYNIVNTLVPNVLEMLAATPAPVQNDILDDDDEPLNENDDDDLDDGDQGEDLNTTHLVLAQFDKVTKTKKRWKCTLKDGIMLINNKDILFNKATVIIVNWTRHDNLLRTPGSTGMGCPFAALDTRPPDTRHFDTKPLILPLSNLSRRRKQLSSGSPSRRTREHVLPDVLNTLS